MKQEKPLSDYTTSYEISVDNMHVTVQHSYRKPSSSPSTEQPFLQDIIQQLSAILNKYDV